MIRRVKNLIVKHREIQSKTHPDRVSWRQLGVSNILHTTQSNKKHQNKQDVESTLQNHSKSFEQNLQFRKPQINFTTQN